MKRNYQIYPYMIRGESEIIKGEKADPGSLDPVGS